MSENNNNPTADTADQDTPNKNEAEDDELSPTSAPLRTVSTEASADAAACGTPSTTTDELQQPSSPSQPQPSRFKKGARNTLIQKPGAYAVSGAPDDDDAPSAAQSQIPSKKKRFFKNSKSTRPGAYAVASGKGPAKPSKKVFFTSKDKTETTQQRDAVTEPGCPDVAISIIEPPDSPDVERPAISSDNDKKTMKKSHKTGPFTVVGPGASSKVQDDDIENNSKDKDVLSIASPERRSPPVFDNVSVAAARSEGFHNESQSRRQQRLTLTTCEHVRGGEILPEESSVDKHAEWKVGILETRKRKCICLVLLLCIIGIAVGVAVGLSSSSSSNDGDEGPETPPTTNTAPPTIDIEPCIAIEPSYVPSDQLQTIRDSLVSENISEDATLNDPGSAQRRALCWVAEIDQSTSSTTQRYIMAVMKYQLGNNEESKFAKSNWADQSKSECGWEGVTCDSAGKVTAIELDKKGLEGNLPKEMSGLSALSVLDLSFNDKITGEIPEEFSNLGSLTAINFKGVKLTGTLPTFLGQLTSLKRINFDTNEFHGTIPIEYGNLVNLVEVYLDNNNLEGSPGNIIKKWPNLVFLNLEKNKFNGTILDDLISLSAIADISVGFNAFSGTLPSELGEIASLARIQVSWNNMFGTLPTEYGQLAKLVEFVIDDNAFNSTLPTEYGGMTSLHRLDIQKNDITGEVLTDHPVCDLPGLLFFATEGRNFNCECCVERN